MKDHTGHAKMAIMRGTPVLAINPGGAVSPVVDMLAACDTDLLFIDCERTAISIESVQVLTRYAHANGMEAVVRSPTKDLAYLIRYFDCGIDGLVLPQVESPEEIAVLNEAARVVTKGREADLLLIAQIESVEGHAKLDQLMAVPGVDLFLIGPNDLAHSMGFVGDIERPELIAAVDDITSRLVSAGRPFGLPVSATDAAHWVDRGCLFLYSSVQNLLRPGIAALREPVARVAQRTTETMK